MTEKLRGLGAYGLMGLWACKLRIECEERDGTESEGARELRHYTGTSIRPLAGNCHHN